MATATPKTATAKKTATTATTSKPATKKVTAESKVASKTAATAAVKKSAPAKKTTATAAAKPAGAKKSPAKKASTVSPEHRYHMIATAAYFLAERRGFAGGYEMQDWIAAEAEIDAQLKD